MKPGMTSRRTIYAACCVSSGEEVRRPDPIAEKLCDQGALHVVLILGDGMWLERLAVEIAGQDEGTIVLCVVPGKAEEGVLGFEIADLQDAVDLCVQAGTTAGERQLRF